MNGNVALDCWVTYSAKACISILVRCEVNAVDGKDSESGSEEARAFTLTTSAFRRLGASGSVWIAYMVVLDTQFSDMCLGPAGLLPAVLSHVVPGTVAAWPDICGQVLHEFESKGM